MRERNAFEIAAHLEGYVRKAITEVNMAIEYEKSSDELRGRIDGLLKKIEEADKEEVELIKEKLADEKLQKECKALWQDVEKARKDLRNENYEELKEYLQKVQNILQNIEYDLENYKLDSKYQIKEKLGGGREASVYKLENYEDRVIRIIEDAKTLRDLKKRLRIQEQMPSGVNAALTMEVGYYEGEPAEIINRAEGHEVHVGADEASELSQEERYELWSNRNKEYAKAPQTHFAKLIKDTKILIKHSLYLDKQGCNILYDEENGFTWIDLGFYGLRRRKDREQIDYPNFVSLIASPKSARDFEDYVNKDDLQNLVKIYRKIEKAGFLGGPRDEEKKIIQKIENGEKPSRSRDNPFS